MPTLKPGPVKKTARERFWAKVEKTDHCWLWRGSLNGHYGMFAIETYPKTKTIVAHRFAYMDVVGPIPEGLHIDHLCRNRACVNPEHLEAVTPAENARRGKRGRLVTQCRHGHPYDEDNTRYRRDGRRRCRTCARERMAVKRAAGYIAPCRRKERIAV